MRSGMWSNTFGAHNTHKSLISWFSDKEHFQLFSLQTLSAGQIRSHCTLLMKWRRAEMTHYISFRSNSVVKTKNPEHIDKIALFAVFSFLFVFRACSIRASHGKKPSTDSVQRYAIHYNDGCILFIREQGVCIFVCDLRVRCFIFLCH